VEVRVAVIPGSVGDKPYFDPVTVPSSNETTGPLAGHVRKGRTYRSPLAATGVLTIGDWVRDDLPDLLWPVLTLSELGTAEASDSHAGRRPFRMTSQGRPGTASSLSVSMAG